MEDKISVGDVVFKARIEGCADEAHVEINEARVISAGKTQLKLDAREMAWGCRSLVAPGEMARTKEGALAKLYGRCCADVAIAKEKVREAERLMEIVAATRVE